MVSSTETNVQANGKADPVRHTENHLPCIWGDQFSGFSLDNSVLEAYGKEIEGLKQQVRAMLRDGSGETSLEKIDFIDSLHRLGVSYHFEKDINGQLKKMFVNPNFQDDYEEYDLYTTSLHFRVFRQHGFKMSCDVFNKFKDSSTSSNFKKSLATDIKGMLSLYEASHLRLRGEDVLEEALAFAVTHLKGVEATSQISPLLQKQVTRALWQPFHMGIPRIETRYYISVYGEDVSRNELLLKFAKLDFNLLQLLYKQELSLLSKWWNNKGFLSTFPYDKHVRSRLVESYFFASTIYFEPSYSLGRIMLAKYLTLAVVADDIYDVYGTVEELQLLTDAIDKWERMNGVDLIPDYMKPLYSEMMETFNEFNDDMMKVGRSYSVYYAKEAIKQVYKANFQEAKWYENGHVPEFDEYMKVAKVSSLVESLIATAFMGMDVASEEVCKWFHGRPEILETLEVVGRLQDDIYGTELETKVSSVRSYIKQYGVSEEEAVDRLKEIVANAWKDMNEEWLTLQAEIPVSILQRFINLARFMNGAYKNMDGFDFPKKYKQFIHDLLIDPIPM